MQIALISAIASLENTDNIFITTISTDKAQNCSAQTPVDNNIGNFQYHFSVYTYDEHQQAHSVHVAMHKDSLEDGVHHVLYFVLVFLKLQRKKHNYRQESL